ncbi:MAG: PIN domain nuclease [Crenarchaeota archaeon]|nr:PIN domain nuclease [Thermoproteota archaeon]
MRPTNNNERRSKGGDSTILERCIILDSSAIFHIRDPSIITSLRGRIYVTDKVLEELRDPRALAIIDIVNPEKVTIDTKNIRRTQDLKDLSETDISILICAEQLKNICREVIVVTDDIRLSKALRKRRIQVVSVYYPPDKGYRRKL